MTFAIYTALLLACTLLPAIVRGDDSFYPDCDTCEFDYGIGHVKHPYLCRVYYVCTKYADIPGKYDHKLRCCPEGLSWDEEDLTCSWKKGESCIDSIDVCPLPLNTTTYPCVYKASEEDPTIFIRKETHEVFQCPIGEIYDADVCGCVRSGDYHPVPCDKILHFDFNIDFDFNSRSCNSIISGDPIGKPEVQDGVLYLDGDGSHLSIGFLNNWFASNPLADTWTLCLWISPTADGLEGRGVFSTNCNLVENHVTLLGMYTLGDTVGSVIGDGNADYDDFPMFYSPPTPVNAWSKLCVTFERGTYKFYHNGQQYQEHTLQGLPTPVPYNSHRAATLGYKAPYGTFQGYMDDLCFWGRTLSAEEIDACYLKGPSNGLFQAGG